MTRAAAGDLPDRDTLAPVIERWRASTMSHRGDFGDDTELGSWREETAPREDAPPLQPSPYTTTTPASDVQRPSILRRPISPGPAPANPGPGTPAPLPSRYR